MFKTTIQTSYEMCHVIDALASDLCAVDFSKIVPLPEDAHLIMDGFSDESLYYFLTDRMTKEFSVVDYQLYITKMNPTPTIHSVNIDVLKKHTQNLVNQLAKKDGTEILYASGQAIFNMINHYGIKLLALWRLEHWGQYLNTLQSRKVDVRTVELYTMDDPKFIVDRFIQKFLLAPKTDVQVRTETVSFVGQ